ncbi:MAG: sensor histidine kinase [Clostridia bacterium]|nr:sensor histidine kinase [Clostridia bacterium]
MKELSLNILDITENSVKAKATLVEIAIEENDDILTIAVTDNGIGMTEQTLLSVTNPFYTTRTTRKVGLGIPLLKFAAEQTGGGIEIVSKHVYKYPKEHGTRIFAKFFKKHIDFTPLGDVISSIVTLVQGHPDVDFVFKHTHPQKNLSVLFDTREVREVLEGIPLDSFEILTWIKDNLTEQYAQGQ